MHLLEGDVNATQWGAPCLQPSQKNGGTIGSEDCLFLNVFAPALPDAGDGHPVLIWIHGGGFRRGAATQYEMRALVDKNTIVVSIQYRLGSLGRVFHYSIFIYLHSAFAETKLGKKDQFFALSRIFKRWH